MNGSYSVPIGSRRSPLIACDSPSADSRMNRLFSAMPSSMCWPVGEKSQLKVDGMRSLLKVSAIFSCANSPRRLTQGPRLVETVTSGEVVTMRAASSEVCRAELVEQRTEAGLRRHLGRDRDRQLGRHRELACARRLLGARPERHPVEKSLQVRRRHVEPFELVPFAARTDAHRGAEYFHLGRRHEARMVVLVARKRQAVALDGVADEADRPVMVDLAEGLEQPGEIVPRQIGHEPRERVVAARLDQPGDVALVADVVEQPLAPRRPALEHQRRIELVGAAVDPFAQARAARLRERGLQQRAVLQDDDVPAEGAKQLFVALPQALAHHRVEALPIVVDDPPAIAQALLPALEHRLEDVALVELGVAHQRHHAALRTVEPPAVRPHIVLQSATRRESAPRRGRPSRWRNRRRRRPWCATDSSARPCSRETLRAFRGSAGRADTGWHERSDSHAASPRRGPAA